jgi:hypothetical protein
LSEANLRLGIILLAVFLLGSLGLAIVGSGSRPQTSQPSFASYDFEDCPRHGANPPGWVVVQSPGAYVQCSQAAIYSGSWSVLVRGKGNYSYAYRKGNLFDADRGDKNLTISGYLRFESIPTQDPRIFFLGKLFHSHLVVYNPQGAVAFGASFIGTTDLLAWRQKMQTPCFPWCTSPITVTLSQELQAGVWYKLWMRLSQGQGENLIEYRITDLSTGKVIGYTSTNDFVPQTKIDRIDIGYDQDAQRAGFADSADTYYNSITVEASGSANTTRLETANLPPSDGVSVESAGRGLINRGGAGQILVNEVELNPQFGFGLPFVALANPTDYPVSFQRLEITSDAGGSVSYWERHQVSMQPHTRSVWDPPTKNTTAQITLYVDGAEVDRTPTLSDPWADNRTWQRCPDRSWIFVAPTTNSSESSASINTFDSRLAEPTTITGTTSVGKEELNAASNGAFWFFVRCAKSVCELFHSRWWYSALMNTFSVRRRPSTVRYI